MNVAIVDVNIHIKNRQGLEKLLQYLKIPYTIQQHFNTFEPYTLIISPGKPLNASAYPSKQFIFGPHFEVLPKAFPIINRIDNCHKNSIYIQPSEWVQKLFQPNVSMPVVVFPFPVDTDYFKSDDRVNPIASNEIMLYFKARDPSTLTHLQSFFREKGYTIHIFDYQKRYTEQEYIRILKRVQFGVWCGCHESQGFAFQEALAMNVPLFVWNVKTLADQYNGNRPALSATTLAYWDDSCGNSFTDSTDLEGAFTFFLENLKNGQYQPRKFVENTLSVKACAERFVSILKKN